MPARIKAPRHLCFSQHHQRPDIRKTGSTRPTTAVLARWENRRGARAAFLHNLGRTEPLKVTSPDLLRAAIAQGLNETTKLYEIIMFDAADVTGKSPAQDGAFYVLPKSLY